MKMRLKVCHLLCLAVYSLYNYGQQMPHAQVHPQAQPAPEAMVILATQNELPAPEVMIGQAQIDTAPQVPSAPMTQESFLAQCDQDFFCQMEMLQFMTQLPPPQPDDGQMNPVDEAQRRRIEELSNLETGKVPASLHYPSQPLMGPLTPSNSFAF